MVEQKAKSSASAKQVDDHLLAKYNVALIKHDIFEPIEKLAKLTEAKIDQLVFSTPIEELLFSTTGLDAPLESGTLLKKSLLFEVKSIKNVSKPFQRVKDPDLGDTEPKEQKIGPKKGQTYQIIGHDGVRFLKLVLLFKEQKPIITKINEVNKYVLSAGVFVSRVDGQTSLLVDHADQITCIYNDAVSPKIQESTMDIKGLPIRQTGAPKFVYLNEKGSRQNHIEPTEEVEDEHADLFLKFDVPDLTAHERTYINRFQQIGFWRKKFPIVRENVDIGGTVGASAAAVSTPEEAKQ